MSRSLTFMGVEPVPDLVDFLGAEDDEDDEGGIVVGSR